MYSSSPRSTISWDRQPVRAERRLEDELRLAGEGSAAVQPADPVLSLGQSTASRFHRHPGLGRCGGRAPSAGRRAWGRHLPTKGESRGDHGGRTRRSPLANGAGLRDRVGIAAEEVDDDRLAGRCRRPRARVGATDAAGGFEMSTMTSVPGSSARRSQAVEHHRPADALVEVASADPDRLRDPRALPMDEAAHLLEAGAGRGRRGRSCRVGPRSRTPAARHRGSPSRSRAP